MSWKLEGSYSETCSCDLVCPCTASFGVSLVIVAADLGVQRAPIEVREDGLSHSVRIGDAVDFEIEDVVPFGMQTGEPAKLTGINHPAGSDVTVARATRSKIDAFGIGYQGNAGCSTSQFSWVA